MQLNFPISVAYNMKDKKIGCVLTQAALGATLSGGALSFHFDAKYWELNPTKCKLYKIGTQKEFDFMVQITEDSHK